MLLTIDIGNSSTKFGVFEDGRLTAKTSIETSRSISAEEISNLIQNRLPEGIESIVISTVVNEVIEAYSKFGRTHFDVNPVIIDHNFDFGFEIKYFPKEDCGSDRLIDAYAAVEKYGSPCIVCDFGTATTIDLVNQRNEYVGGIITPGPHTLGSALYNKTSKLPKVDFEKPRSVIGNSTVTSIQSGIYFGYVGLVDGIIDRFIDEIDEKPTIVSTGGFASAIAEESRHVEIVENELMLTGLYLIHKKMGTE